MTTNIPGLQGIDPFADEDLGEESKTSQYVRTSFTFAHLMKWALLIFFFLPPFENKIKNRHSNSTT